MLQSVLHHAIIYASEGYRQERTKTMKVTKKIEAIVEKANNALYNLCLDNLTAADARNTDQRRAAAERSANYFGGYRLALLDALEILGIDIDKDVKLDQYSEVLKLAIKHYEQDRK